MNSFLDANVLIAVLNRQYPYFPASARLLSLSGSRKVKLCTSALALAIAFYFTEKKYGTVEAKKKISIMSQHINLLNCGIKEIESALINKKVHDFEDGLQYYSALHGGCKNVITYDLNDFYFSDLEVITPELFLEKYLL